VPSFGVFRYELLEDLKDKPQATGPQLWRNHVVAANDGGVSLGLAALASFRR
jgi:hypothetical protein